MWRVRAFIRTTGWRMVNLGHWLVKISASNDGGASSGDKLNMKPLTGAALERAVKLARERGWKSL